MEQQVNEWLPPGATTRIMFEDEGRFGRINGPKRCWAPRGVRPEVACQLIREYTHVFAAVSPKDGTLDSLILPEANTVAMSVFLKEVSSRHAEEFILMFLDGAAWHRSHGLVVPPNIRLAFLPPYSPQLNPTEHIWDEIQEKWFPNKVFRSLPSVEDTLETALLTLENDRERVRNLIGFDWILSNT